MWGLAFAWGVFGGVAGNQGGLRSGALLAFGLASCTFVATSAATGLLVDAARLPVYLWQARSELWALPRLPLWIGLATAGVLAGTLVGERVLFGLSPERFRRLIAAAVGALGLWLLVSAA